MWILKTEEKAGDTHTHTHTKERLARVEGISRGSVSSESGENVSWEFI